MEPGSSGRRVVGSRGVFCFRGFGPFGLRVVGFGLPRAPWVAGSPGSLGRSRLCLGSLTMINAVGSEDPAARHKEAEAWFLHEAQPTPCPGALPLRLASVTGDNALGDFGVGADVGEHGQNFGLTTHLFSTKLSVPKAHLLAWRTPPGVRSAFHRNRLGVTITQQCPIKSCYRRPPLLIRPSLRHNFRKKTSTSKV